jgi:UDP-glucose 4-epimerase
MGSTALVTGGAGFVGSHLIRLMLASDPDTSVISVDNYFTGSAANHVADPRVQYVTSSTVDIQKVWSANGFDAPGIVYHLGEYSRIVQSFQDFDLTWEFNVHGTKEIVKFAHQCGAKLVYAGSSSKFGNDGRDENLNPYAWTKAKNIEFIRNFGDWFGLDYVITYFYNVYGPGHIRDGRYATVIGVFERQFERGEPLTVVSPGTQTRDFTHVDDIVAGILTCARKGSGDGYLLGTGREWPILEVAELFGSGHVLVPALPGERQQGRADITQASNLGWTAQRDLASYVRDFVARHAAAQPG